MPIKHVRQLERLYPKLRSLKHVEFLDPRDLPPKMTFSHWVIYYWDEGHMW